MFNAITSPPSPQLANVDRYCLFAPLIFAERGAESKKTDHCLTSVMNTPLPNVPAKSFSPATASARTPRLVKPSLTAIQLSP